jgi:ATP-dependent DNA helicase DinG
MLEASDKLKEELKILRGSMIKLSAHLRRRLDDEADSLSPDHRKRFDAVAQSLDRRANMTLSAWIGMLETLESGLNPVEWVDWMSLERVDSKIFDIGMYRHYIDPTKPFSAAIKPHAHSMIVTSATLRDGAANSSEQQGWETAITMTGASHLSHTPLTFSIPSPFDYAAKTRVFIINDIRKNDMDQMAAAYRELFLASDGGGLGLFTSIQRLKNVHAKIQDRLSRDGITLYAQHVDGIDSGTLVDMFRDDTHSCLLGTDAVRDGVDVPGNSLRMIVFDRVPWPRATLLHKARKKALGGSAYDDRLTRLKLKQAYGRLIRRGTDKGVFIMLDSALPQRLQSAFPEGVAIEKIGLAEAIEKTREFMAENS